MSVSSIVARSSAVAFRSISSHASSRALVVAPRASTVAASVPVKASRAFGSSVTRNARRSVNVAVNAASNGTLAGDGGGGTPRRRGVCVTCVARHSMFYCRRRSFQHPTCRWSADRPAREEGLHCRHCRRPGIWLGDCQGAGRGWVRDFHRCGGPGPEDF